MKIKSTKTAKLHFFNCTIPPLEIRLKIIAVVILHRKKVLKK